jgi:hypothetical protein
MSERVRPVSEVLRTAQAAEPEMAAVREEMEGYRFQYMHTIVRWLAERARLRVPQIRATQIVWALASPDIGRMLCEFQGWTTGEYAAWLAETLAATLLTAECVAPALLLRPHDLMDASKPPLRFRTGSHHGQPFTNWTATRIDLSVCPS